MNPWSAPDVGNCDLCGGAIHRDIGLAAWKHDGEGKLHPAQPDEATRKARYERVQAVRQRNRRFDAGIYKAERAVKKHPLSRRRRREFWVNPLTGEWS